MALVPSQTSPCDGLSHHTKMAKEASLLKRELNRVREQAMGLSGVRMPQQENSTKALCCEGTWCLGGTVTKPAWVEKRQKGQE